MKMIDRKGRGSTQHRKQGDHAEACPQGLALVKERSASSECGWFIPVPAEVGRSWRGYWVKICTLIPSALALLEGIMNLSSRFFTALSQVSKE